MFKKIFSISLIFITLFYINIGIIQAYEFQNPNNESDVKNMISDIYNMKQQYEDLLGEDEEEEISDVYTSNNSNYWWPIGSIETEEINGKLFAGGDPETVYVSSAFGTRADPFTGVVKVHRGTDISGGTYSETNIIAAKDGVVVYPNSLDGNNCPDNRTSPGVCSAYGNYVKIQHSDGNYTVYGHLYENSITVKAGDYVSQGQVIAKMGSSGSSTGPHLHFEIRFGNDAYSSSEPTVGIYIFQDNPRPGAANVVDGKDSKQTVCLTLKNQYNDNAVTAIMTNMYYESNFIVNNLEQIYEKPLGYTDESYTAAVDNGTYTNFVNDNAGYGLAQWTYYTRKQNLLNYKQEKNTSIGDIGMQLEFFVKELTENFSEVNNYINNVSHTYENDTVYFCEVYEKPAGSCSTRLNTAESIYKYVTNSCQD